MNETEKKELQEKLCYKKESVYAKSSSEKIQIGKESLSSTLTLPPAIKNLNLINKALAAKTRTPVIPSANASPSWQYPSRGNSHSTGLAAVENTTVSNANAVSNLFMIYLIDFTVLDTLRNFFNEHFTYYTIPSMPLQRSAGTQPGKI